MILSDKALLRRAIYSACISVATLIGAWLWTIAMSNSGRYIVRFENFDPLLWLFFFFIIAFTCLPVFIRGKSQ